MNKVASHENPRRYRKTCFKLSVAECIARTIIRVPTSRCHLVLVEGRHLNSISRPIVYKFISDHDV